MRILRSIWKWLCELFKYQECHYGSTDSHRWASKTEIAKGLSSG
jgi:hypothetical protein